MFGLHTIELEYTSLWSNPASLLRYQFNRHVTNCKKETLDDPVALADADMGLEAMQ